jgi:chromosome partitioning protein
MRIIAVTNQKGGTGKTTTAVNLSVCLASLGKKVLVVVMDPQANSTIHLGINSHELEASLYDLLVSPETIEARTVIKKTDIKNLEILPSNLNLSTAEIDLVNAMGREYVLKDSLKPLAGQYDYVLIDCPPSVGLLTINALTAATEVFIPVQAEYFALEGMTKLLEIVDRMNKRLNEGLRVTGIVITMYDSRNNICKDVAEKIEDYFKDRVFQSKIRVNVKLKEAPSCGQPVLIFAPDSHGSEDYSGLAKEVVQQENRVITEKQEVLTNV